MRIREGKWHQFVKASLKEIGEKNGFDVSESEKEMYFPVKFALFNGDSAEKHILTYKPDIVWKKGINYHVIFEIEYLDPKSRILDKRKYVLGTFLLGLIALSEKSCKNLVLITNRETLVEDSGTCYKILNRKKILSKDFLNNIYVHWYCFDSSYDKRYRDPTYLKKELLTCLSEDFRLELKGFSH